MPPPSRPLPILLTARKAFTGQVVTQRTPIFNGSGNGTGIRIGSHFPEGRWTAQEVAPRHPLESAFGRRLRKIIGIPPTAFLKSPASPVVALEVLIGFVQILDFEGRWIPLQFAECQVFTQLN
jgi:hypothetical protein